MIEQPPPPTKTHFQTLILGGGTAGIAVAARLCRALEEPDVAILEPADKHHYQPLWTLVGAGVVKKEQSERPESSLIPAGAVWIKGAARGVLPEENTVLTDGGERLTYDFLVVAAGIQLDWDGIEGCGESLGRAGVCSNYSWESVDSTWESIRGFGGGTAIFTHPATPIKCGGAPQKIMYLAADYWRKNPPAHPYEIVFGIATPAIFSVPHYARTLVRVARRYGIEVLYRHDLTAIDRTRRTVRFKRLDRGDEVERAYSLLHVTPPMGAPDFIAKSALANGEGWAEADKHTLQHPRFANVFCLGDASSLPTSKTGAAIREQAPVLARNLLAAARSAPLEARYDGYTSCPLVTGYGKLVLAEFDYEGRLRETFPFDQNQERLSMYWLKRFLLPRFYWDWMLKGRG